MDINVHYYNAGWIDLSSYATGFHVEDEGINRVATATVNLAGPRTEFDAYLANPYRLMRIRIKPTTEWQNIFYGYVDNPFLKSESGTSTNRNKLSLDCLGGESRLTSDYITFDYYKLQSAITPYAGAESWTYRKMIEDMFLYPDSTQDGTGLSGTGLTLEAATNPSGIDHLLDKSCTWDKQTIFEAVRTVCDRIGYDGYYIVNESWAHLYLYPFSKSSVATLSDPFLREPQWEGGSLQDLANVIFIWGGSDAGIPSDGDRFTEYGVTKYDPASWVTLYVGGTPWTSDEDNSVFSEVLRVNSKCIKSVGTGFTDEYCEDLYTTLDLQKTEYGVIDAENRCTSFVLNLKFYQSNSTYGRRVISFILSDNAGNKILYQTEYGSDSPPNYPAGYEKQYSIPIGTDQEIVTVSPPFFTNCAIRKWNYFEGTTFDWEHIIGFTVLSHWRGDYPPSDTTWGHYIDGLMFVGGYPIEPFREYSELLNPPAHDHTSINTYGVHVLHYQDTLLSSFEQAQAEGARLLLNLKNPNPTLTCTKIAPTTQLRPSNVVTVVGVNNRIVSVAYDWNAKDKQCYATYKMVGMLMPLPPIWTEINEMRFLVK